MARLNIEDRFFAESCRYRKLARLMNWTEEQAIGHLIKLWYHSQSEMEYKVDSEDIVDWSDVSPKEGSEYLNALCHKRVRFCDLLNDGRYIIRGNKKHVDSLRKYKERTEKGNRTKEKNKQKNKKVAPKIQNCHSENRGLNLLEYKETAAYAMPEQTLSDPKAPTNTNTNTNINKVYVKKNIYKKNDTAGEGEDKTEKPNTPPKKKVTTSKQKPQTKTWSPQNRFANVFGRLIDLEPYRAVLDVPKDEIHLTRYMSDYDLSLEELEKIAIDFFNHYESQQHLLNKNVRSRFTTFCRNFADWRNKGIRRTASKNNQVDSTRWAKSKPVPEDQHEDIPF